MMKIMPGTIGLFGAYCEECKMTIEDLSGQLRGDFQPSFDNSPSCNKKFCRQDEQPGIVMVNSCGSDQRLIAIIAPHVAVLLGQNESSEVLPPPLTPRMDLKPPLDCGLSPPSPALRPASPVTSEVTVERPNVNPPASLDESDISEQSVSFFFPIFTKYSVLTIVLILLLVYGLATFADLHYHIME